MNKKNIPPAQLWVGPHDHVLTNLITYLQSVLCPNGGCSTCAVCTHVQTQQHHALLFLSPSTYYTLDDLEPLFTTLSFSLQNEQRFFFIIQKADCLTQTCANALLKSMEEPPQGYHFILITDRPEQLLPTVRSRCITRHFYGAAQQLQEHELFNAFTAINFPQPAPFLKIIESAKITERESIEILDALIAYWLLAARTALINGSAQQCKATQRKVELLTQARLQPPMPGSSKLFWRDLYLDFAV